MMHVFGAKCFNDYEQNLSAFSNKPLLCNAVVEDHFPIQGLPS